MGYWSDKAIEVGQYGNGWLKIEKKFVCTDCLREEGISEFIRSHGDEGQCSYCNATAHVATMCDVVPHIIWSLSLEWGNPEEELPYDSEDGVYLFGEPTSTHDLLGNYLFEGYYDGIPEELIDDITSTMPQYEWAEVDAVRTTKAERLTNSWDAFCHIVKHERRYFFGVDLSDKIILQLYGDEVELAPQELLQLILEFLRNQDRIRSMPKGWQVKRCRAKDPGEGAFDAVGMGPPPLGFSKQPNRMSPAGVSMFYGSTQMEVCLREIADKPGNFACGTFEVDRDIHLIDLTGEIKIPSIFDERSNRDRPLWVFIKRFLDDFRKPILKDGREHIEYVPTQVVCEYFRSTQLEEGISVSGVIYDSSHVPGKDAVVIFADSSSVDMEAPATNSLRLNMIDYEEVGFTP